MRASASVLAVVLVLLVTLGQAQVPRTLSYQGVLTDTLGHPKPDGSYNFTFRLYATNIGGTAIWSETKTLSLTRGLFSTSLGDQVPIGLRFDAPYWVGVQVGADPELSPRVQLTSGGYSFRSLNADTAQYAKSAPQQAYVDSARIAGTIPDNGVVTAKIADGSVTQVKLAGGVTLPPGGSAGGDLSGTFPNPTITGSAVNSAKLADNAVTSSKLADGSVTTSKLADNGITAQKIQSTQVVKSINTLHDNVVLSAGTNVSITPSGSTLTIAATGGGTITAVNAGTGLTGGGTSGAVTLSVAAPLQLTGSYPNSYLISSYNQSGPAMYAQTGGSSDGIFAESGSGNAVDAISGTGAGVNGTSTGSYGVRGRSQFSYGVYGTSDGGSGNAGVYGVGSTSSTIGVLGYSAGTAGYFSGNVGVSGSLSKGSGSFKIDHPLDPAGKYLYHSFVESPDMMNIYNGNLLTDASGDATVILPEYFESLNREYRYQLTVIGQFAQAIVKEEIVGNRFSIKTDKPKVKVSWQVTGIRHDPFAEAHRVQVEVEKTGTERGKYIHPKEYGVSETLGVDFQRIQEIEQRKIADQETAKRIEQRK